MKSPFPGMDPYLERHWGDVHERLIVYTADALQVLLPDDLVARIEERVFVETGAARSRQLIPDVVVSEGYPPGVTDATAFREEEAGVAEPMVFELDELEVREGYIVIREAEGGRVITAFEFLSPSNKRAGAGQSQYLAKQREVLCSDANLVEIDLVRSGERVLALPRQEIPARHKSDYLVCISPGMQRSRRELYVMPLRQRLPVLPIPLRKQEVPVKLDLQLLVDQVYVAGRYRTLDYRAEPEPPWAVEDALWADGLLRAAGRR